MFTGIIQSQGKIAALERGPQFCVLAISVEKQIIDNLKEGASVAVSGVCLTVKKIEGLIVFFDISPETEQRTTLAYLKTEDVVNIERSLKMGDEMGGHVVSGHIDTVGKIITIQNDSSGVIYEISCEEMYMKYILNKGFITVDGVSLTVNTPTQHSFFVHLIPETISRTTFSVAKVGDTVNIECDKMTQVIVSTVERILNKT